MSTSAIAVAGLGKKVAYDGPEDVWWNRQYLLGEAALIILLCIVLWDDDRLALAVSIIYGVHWLVACAVGYRWCTRPY